MKSTLKISLLAVGISFVTAGALVFRLKAGVAAPALDASLQQVPVSFAGGYETDPRDMGRPVVLIASALGVPSEVFREAFSHVRPAPAGTAPDQERVQDNKRALLDALAKYGVTNERLDEVSNYYRYNRSRGEMWPKTPASALAIIKNGKLIGFKVTQGGAGYSSTPTVSVPGFEGSAAQVQLAYGKEFESNGSIASIQLQPAKKK